MTFEEVLSQLSDDQKSVIVAAVEAEKTRGIEASRKKGADVNAWMTKANKRADIIKRFDLDPDADDLEAQVEAITSKLRAGSPATTAPEIDALKRQISALTLKSEQAEKRALEKTRQSAKSQAVSFLKGKIVAESEIVDALFARGILDIADDGETVFKQGDTILPFTDGIGQYLKENPHLVLNSQKPGSEGNPGATGTAQKTMRRSVFEALNPQEKSAAMRSGITITD